MVVSVVTLGLPMTEDLTDRAIVEHLRRYVQQRIANGEIQLTIANDLGIDRAMVSKYKSGELPKTLKPATVRAFAKLLGVDTSELERIALKEFERRANEFPPQFKAAITFLNETHGRDFTEAARTVLQSAAHRPESMTIDSLAAQIYDAANEEKGKSVVSAVEVTSDGAELGRPERAKK